jgi:ectoine hydroxylase-related dioxygenase (phytanoyl-CoA dioxygenase family)
MPVVAQHRKEAMTRPTFRLSQDQVAFFKREGYLSVDHLTTDDDVAKLRASYDRIFQQRAGREEGNQFDLAGTDEEGKEAALPQILDPAKYAPEMNDSLLLANATQLVRDLFGPEATCAIAHAIFKPARKGAATPWHQDAAYWNPMEDYPNTVSIWVPLQQATVENGCMQFVPRSHQAREIWRHQSVNNDPRIHALELHPTETGRVGGAVACPMPAGGCTVHGGYTLHYTAPNTSDIPRRALILLGGLPPVKRSTPRENPWTQAKKTAREERAKAFAAKAGEGA